MGGLTVKDLNLEAGCCDVCPDKGCEGCDCAKPANMTGGCMGGACGCGNR